MAKTIINLSDPVSTLVSKTNTISDNVGDLSLLNVGASNDSDLVQAINFINSNNTDSAAITTLIDSAYVEARSGFTRSSTLALFIKDSANGIGLDSSEGRFFIAPNTVNTSMIETGAITTAKILDDNITTIKLAAGSVTSAKIATDAVTSGEIAAGAVGTSELAALAVTTAKIAADAIDGTKIADDAINSEHYVDGSIDTAHIADDQITEAKIANDAVGSAELKSLSTLLIINSSGTTVKTIHGAGA